jgi:hypothetical protein
MEDISVVSRFVKSFNYKGVVGSSATNNNRNGYNDRLKRHSKDGKLDDDHGMLPILKAHPVLSPQYESLLLMLEMGKLLKFIQTKNNPFSGNLSNGDCKSKIFFTIPPKQLSMMCNTLVVLHKNIFNAYKGLVGPTRQEAAQMKLVSGDIGKLKATLSEVKPRFALLRHPSIANSF